MGKDDDAFRRQQVLRIRVGVRTGVLDVGTDSLTVNVSLNPGHGMKYQSQVRRFEV